VFLATVRSDLIVIATSYTANNDSGGVLFIFTEAA